MIKLSKPRWAKEMRKLVDAAEGAYFLKDNIAAADKLTRMQKKLKHLPAREIKSYQGGLQTGKLYGGKLTTPSDSLKVVKTTQHRGTDRAQSVARRVEDLTAYDTPKDLSAPSKRITVKTEKGKRGMTVQDYLPHLPEQADVGKLQNQAGRMQDIKADNIRRDAAGKPRLIDSQTKRGLLTTNRKSLEFQTAYDGRMRDHIPVSEHKEIGQAVSQLRSGKAGTRNVGLTTHLDRHAKKYLVGAGVAGYGSLLGAGVYANKKQEAKNQKKLDELKVKNQSRAAGKGY